MPSSAAGLAGDIAIFARVGFGHVGEAGTQRLVVAPDQRVLPHEVDVIGDQHQFAGMEFGIDGAGGVGEDHAIDAALGELTNAEGDFGAGIAFVIVGAAGEHHHFGFAQAAGDQFAGVSGGGDGRPPGDVLVRSFKTILQGFGKRA